MAYGVAEYLRKAWDAADLRRFDWYTWKAQSEHQRQGAIAKRNLSPSRAPNSVVEQVQMALAEGEAREPPSVVTPVEAAIFHLRQNRRRALHCLNPECPSRYFFRARKGQQYCSPECAKPAQREAT